MFPGVVKGEATEITDAEIVHDSERVSGTDSGTEGTANPQRRPSPARERGSLKYRHGDSNPGFRRERAAS
jgi:hypothetical protein